MYIFIYRNFKTIILVISILSLIFTFYKSEIYWSGVKREYYYLYYLVSFLLFLFSSVYNYINNKFKDYIVLSFLTLLFVSYLSETYLTFKFYSDEKKMEEKISELAKLYKEKTGKEYDKTSKVDLFYELKKNDKNVTGIIYSKNILSDEMELFPLGGISNVQTIHCNELGYMSIYKSDRYGYNNPDYEWNSKIIEYFLLGDSFLHGACVNRPDDIASIIRGITNSSVLNLGFGGSGPLTQYARLKEFLEPNVKKVFWLYYEGNDLDDLSIEIKNKILFKYFNNSNFSQNIKSSQLKVDELLRKKIDQVIFENSLVEKSQSNEVFFKIFKFIKLRSVRKFVLSKWDKNKYDYDKNLLNFKKILVKARNLSEKNNSVFYFVYIPELQRYNTIYDYSDYQNIKKIINNLEINFIDISQDELFKKNGINLYSKTFGNSHLNINGYKRIGQILAEK